LRKHKKQVTAVAFHPDGKQLITGSTDETARLWIIEPEALNTALWDATLECLSEPRRRELLLESSSDARKGYERCQRANSQH